MSGGEPDKPARLTGRLVVATHNPGKLREIRELLAPSGVDAVSAGELKLDEPEETGASFRDNAALKAEAAARASGTVALADDSGLCVEALGGAPGIYSARWAGGGKDFAAAMTRVERELKERLARRRRGAPPSSAFSPSPGRTGRWKRSKGGSMGRSSSRRAGRPGSATIRSFAPTGTPGPSAR